LACVRLALGWWFPGCRVPRRASSAGHLTSHVSSAGAGCGGRTGH
jgi:hypothetical protein